MYSILQTLMWPPSLFAKFKYVLRILLLPVGYPSSVCPEYIAFQFWDTIQEGCGYFRGILNNQAWLVTLGVGNAGTTVV